MKSFIKKLLFGDNVISEYPTIRIPGKIQEKVYLEAAENFMDITQRHWLLCLDPFIWGIWLNGDKQEIVYKKDAQFYIHFFDSANDARDKKNALAILRLVFFDCIEEKNGALLLFQVKKANVYYLDFLRRYFLFSRYYKKNDFTFFKFKSLAAAYSYPRRIRLVSFRQEYYYNIFPMDLLGDIGDSKRFVFGLRHTNVSLPKIIETGKLVVSEVSFDHKHKIYELGKHHSTKPPSLDALSFNLLHSKNFEFYLPEWINSYKEIEILKTMNLGSQMLLWGKVLHEDIFTNSGNNLFVIHFLKYLHQKNTSNCYPLV